MNYARVKLSVFIRFAIFISVIQIVFSLQANYELVGDQGYYSAYYITLLILLFVSLINEFNKLLFLILISCLFFGAIIIVGPLKAIGLALVLPFGYYSTKYHKSAIVASLEFVFFINFMLVVAQFIGLSNSVYQFCHNENLAHYRCFIDQGFGFSHYIPQFRPSGIFPSPTYITAYTVLFLTVVLADTNYNNRTVFFIFGTYLALIGSTAGLCLFILSFVLYINNKKFLYLILGYIILSFLYSILIPDQYIYNFNYIDLLQSFYLRFDLTNSSGESVLQSNILSFFIICFMSLFGILTINSNNSLFSLLRFLPFTISLSLPIFVHDISISLFYWFIVGCAFGMIMNDVRIRIFKFKKNNNKIFKLCGSIGSLPKTQVNASN